MVIYVKTIMLYSKINQEMIKKYGVIKKSVSLYVFNSILLIQVVLFFYCCPDFTQKKNQYICQIDFTLKKLSINIYITKFL